MHTLRLALAALITASSCTAVYAACDPPTSRPTCPPGPELVATGEDRWPCCDQTSSCPRDGTKFARFYRYRSTYHYGQPFAADCYQPSDPAYDGGMSLNECCGDPVN